jgi:uncharacterized surface protein with fasciclin (FAS1) repeats
MPTENWKSGADCQAKTRQCSSQKIPLGKYLLPYGLYGYHLVYISFTPVFWRERMTSNLLEFPMKKLLIASVLALGVAVSAQAKDIVDTAVGAGNFKTLATALGAAGLIDTLKGKGPFTVFAPTDEAFAKVPKADLDALLKDKAKLTAVLTYHVVPGKVMAKDVKAGKVKTVQGSELTISTTGGVKVDAANVIKTDIVADNGVIHVIDSVIMPK